MNLIFISGPQGGGKTTLVKLLEGPHVLIPKLETKTINLDSEPKTRLALKINQRALENFECLKIARSNPEKIVIGNRCIYDQLAFNGAYSNLKWISEAEKDIYDNVSNFLYESMELKEPRAICLNPGYEIVSRHLEQRWKKGKKKWREENKEYIDTICKAYESLKEKKEILYIDHEIDLNSNRDIGVIKDWISSRVI